MIQGGMINNTVKKIDIDFLRKAYNYAELNSDNNTTWTSALFCNDNVILSSGANCYHPNILVTEEIKTSPLKAMYLMHAERAGIYNAAKNGIKLDGSTLYMAWLPCCDCAQSIVGAGVKRMVFHYDMAIKTQIDWSDNIFEALRMLRLADIKIDTYKGSIGNCIHKFKKIEWKP